MWKAVCLVRGDAVFILTAGLKQFIPGRRVSRASVCAREGFTALFWFREVVRGRLAEERCCGSVSAE